MIHFEIQTLIGPECELQNDVGMEGGFPDQPNLKDERTNSLLNDRKFLLYKDDETRRENGLQKFWELILQINQDKYSFLIVVHMNDRFGQRSVLPYTNPTPFSLKRGIYVDVMESDSFGINAANKFKPWYTTGFA